MSGSGFKADLIPKFQLGMKFPAIGASGLSADTELNKNRLKIHIKADDYHFLFIFLFLFLL